MASYGKLVNGGLVMAPLNLEKEDGIIFNYGLEANDKQLRIDGYKPVKLLADKSIYYDCDGTFSYEMHDKGDRLEEIAIFHKYSDEVKAQIIRKQRNQLLTSSDMLVSIPDYPISAQEKAWVVAWRKYLRDLPENSEFPWITIQLLDEWMKDSRE